MASKSLSSASKSASSALSSGSSQASNAASNAANSASSAASTASATLASGSAAASNYAGKAAGDASTTAKSTGIFALFSTLNLSIVAIALGVAYYYGYLDGVIAYIQQMMNQAQDKKEQVLKDNTGQTSFRHAARDQYDSATVSSERMVNDLTAEAKQRTGYQKPDDSAPMFSQQAH